MYDDEPQSNFWFYVRAVATVLFIAALIYVGVMAGIENRNERARLGCDFYAGSTINNVPVSCYQHFGLTQVVK